MAFRTNSGRQRAVNSLRKLQCVPILASDIGEDSVDLVAEYSTAYLINHFFPTAARECMQNIDRPSFFLFFLCDEKKTCAKYHVVGSSCMQCT